MNYLYIFPKYFKDTENILNLETSIKKSFSELNCGQLNANILSHVKGGKNHLVC